MLSIVLKDIYKNLFQDFSGFEQPYQNLIRFVRFNALNLLLLMLFFEMKIVPTNYYAGFISIFSNANRINIPLIPFMTVEFASFSWFPMFIDAFCIISFSLLFLKPGWRSSYILTFVGLVLRNTVTIVNTGVHTATIYTIPLLILCLDPPKPENLKRVRNNILAAIAMMYFISATNKFSNEYLSGNPVEFEIEFARYFAYDLIRYFSKFNSYKIIAIAGIALQYFASLQFFSSTRKFGYLSALIFHFIVSVWIIISVNLCFFACSMIFLFCENRNLKKFNRFISILAILFPMLLYLTNFLRPDFLNLQRYSYDLISIGCAAVATAAAAYYCLTSAVIKTNVFSLLGIGFPAAYALVGLVLMWPQPFGYTQYAWRERPYQYISFPLNYLDSFPSLSRVGGRWEIRFRQDPAAGVVRARFPTQDTADKFLSFLCRLNSDAIYKRIVTTSVKSNGLNDQSFYESEPDKTCKNLM